MAKKNRVIIVTELFYPEESATAYVMTCIANYLSQSIDVLVLAGPETYEGDKKRLSINSNLINSLTIKRVWAPSITKNKIFTRVIRVLIVSFSLAISVFKNARVGDTVFAVTNPAPLPVFLAVIKIVKNFKYVLLIHDVFPENAVSVGLLRSTSKLFLMSRRIFDWAYRSTNLMITIGRDMTDVVILKTNCNSNQVCLIENWADTLDIDPISREGSNIDEWGLRNKLVIQYAGNIGRAQGVLNFSDTLKYINNQDVHFTFVGSGAAAENMREKLKGNKIVSFHGAYARVDQSIILGSCDIALVILGEGMYGLGVPSKTYSIMAAAKPILFLGPRDSEVYKLVHENGIGWAFSWDDIPKMVNFINSLSSKDIDSCYKIGLKSRIVAETCYSKELQMKKFSEALCPVSSDL